MFFFKKIISRSKFVAVPAYVMLSLGEKISCDCDAKLPGASATAEAVYPAFADAQWTRVDDMLMNSKEFKHFVKKNVFHETLYGEGMLERCETFVPKIPLKDDGNNDVPEIITVIKYGDALNGHPGVVHGGILAMCFDNCFGWVFFASKLMPGFTANLNVNFR